MRTGVKLIFFLFVVFALVGCATSSSVVTGTKRPALDPSQVRVYHTAPANYEEVALLSADSGGWTSQGEMQMAVDALKKEAAKNGANGVLMVSQAAVGSGVTGTYNAYTNSISAQQSTYTNMRAVAIYVKDAQ